MEITYILENIDDMIFLSHEINESKKTKAQRKEEKAANRYGAQQK